MFTPDVVYLRWVNIDTKVLGTLLFIVVCLTQRNEKHLVILKNPVQVMLKKRVIIQVQCFITKCLSFRRVSFFQGYRLCIKKICILIILTKKKFSSYRFRYSSNTRIESRPAVINNIRCHPYKRASGPLVCGSTEFLPN